ncbi:t-complex protein 1 beta SU (nucleomorph) [Guillardia theta]|uniref:T-complex protein 1 beta SU n=1 Tax=Guillardia theta TaxID=55529 RepID=Q98S23_GUITH|nr:t-complex protein 1 beta SU [Guillardia theta]AAK39757.1 t-complex protein 1 beta SU [Guillardia theta]|mmetsp:Transcript_20548/g.68868  ORF Transcript_20548/g.68868 Transcript_20548/m.68868 type:complete len:501 (-) Transcript_20548:7351-8853(-)
MRQKFSLSDDVMKIVQSLSTTLGPNGKDKILIDNEGHINTTNDGATILKNIKSNTIASLILKDVCSVQDLELGDGTTTICCLIGEMLREAENLMNQNIHPHSIIEGYRISAKIVIDILRKSSFDNSFNYDIFLADLLDIAKTTLMSKFISNYCETFSRISLSVILKLKGNLNRGRINILKILGGSLKDSYLDNGILIEKSFGIGQPKKLLNARIMILNCSLDSDKIKIYGAKVKVKKLSQMAQIELSENKRLLDKCKKILNHGINVVVNRQLIYDKQERFFTDHGIISIENADFEGIEKLSLAVNSEIASSFDDIKKIKIGKADLVEEISIGSKNFVRFSGFENNGIGTIVIRGSTDEILDEAERALNDTLCVLINSLKNSRFVWGAGCCELKASRILQDISKNFDFEYSKCLNSFARALMSIPTIIAYNSDIDIKNLVKNIPLECYDLSSDSCLDLKNSKLGNARNLGIIEPLKLKIFTILSATEAVEIFIRINKIFLN